MKCIVLFGAGKSSSALINYLQTISLQYNWQVFVADANFALAAQKTGEHSHVKPVQIDVYDEEQRASLIKQADVVISLLPPAFHILVANDCVQYSKHLLTASYIDDQIKSLEEDIKQKNVLFLCEMGLDPGIDHMSAMQLIHEIKKQGGIITSFKSHCGGLIAPESDDNPWHYKISWNTRNVIMAGKAGAVYKENNESISASYNELFVANKQVQIPGLGNYSWYANRDSVSYSHLYNLENAQTFIRTTLRHPEFCFGWKNLIDLKLTDETIFYNTDELSIAAFFKEHFDKYGFGDWLNTMLMSRLGFAKQIMENLTQLIEVEEAMGETGTEGEDFLMVDAQGELTAVDVENEKNKAAELVTAKMHEANLTLNQLFYLGLNDDTLINKGTCSAADILQFILEKKLVLLPHDKDMIVMLHEIEYILDNKPQKKSSFLIVKGENSTQTAMAKTVGLPLGIAAKLLLQGKLVEKGLHIPIKPSIYEPVLKELAEHGIVFKEF